MDKKIIKIVNRLKIKYSKMYEKWQVIAPDGRVLEEFAKFQDAVKWAGDTKDFVRR
jgi:hypothetical protein